MPDLPSDDIILCLCRWPWRNPAEEVGPSQLDHSAYYDVWRYSMGIRKDEPSIHADRIFSSAFPAASAAGRRALIW